MEYVRLFNDLTITAVNTLNMFVLSLQRYFLEEKLSLCLIF
jgi:hypothetical protein